MPRRDPHDRLQPALLDRLTDDSRAGAPGTHGPGDDRAMTRGQLRQAVLRDLGALFNAVQPIDAATLAAVPQLAGTVLAYGLPPLAGQLASKLDLPKLERTLKDALLRFEPRLLPTTIAVRAIETPSVLDMHNVVEFEITAQLWSQPVPLEILLRTQIDLEAGQVRVVDSSRPETPPIRQPVQRNPHGT